MANMFRLLRADEIDARIGMLKPTGASLLLYKDARCDMAILDETVGAYNWKREHSRDNANCTVSLWDEKKNQWISKEDTGTESNTEAEKGLASDSFKRACFNWGIGRELYTAPFIWINGKPEDLKYAKFRVDAIGYDDTRSVNYLVISDAKTNKVIYSYGKGAPKAEPRKVEEPTIVETPAVYSAPNNIKAFCEAQKISVKMFTSIYDALCEQGMTKRIPSTKMTEEECTALLALVKTELEKAS